MQKSEVKEVLFILEFFGLMFLVTIFSFILLLKYYKRADSLVILLGFTPAILIFLLRIWYVRTKGTREQKVGQKSAFYGLLTSLSFIIGVIGGLYSLITLKSVLFFILCILVAYLILYFSWSSLKRKLTDFHLTMPIFWDVFKKNFWWLLVTAPFGILFQVIAQLAFIQKLKNQLKGTVEGKDLNSAAQLLFFLSFVVLTFFVLTILFILLIAIQLYHYFRFT